MTRSSATMKTDCRPDGDRCLRSARHQSQRRQAVSFPRPDLENSYGRHVHCWSCGGDDFRPWEATRSAAERLDETLEALRIDVRGVDPKQAMETRKAFAQYGRRRHPAQFDFGDCSSCALAKARNHSRLPPRRRFRQDRYRHRVAAVTGSHAGPLRGSAIRRTMDHLDRRSR